MRHRKQRADQWPCRLERVCKVSGSHTLTWPSRVPLTTCELSLLWQTQLTPVSCSSSACTQHVDSTVAQITHTTNALSSPHLTLAALAGSSSAGAVQAVCNGPPMSVAQGTTVHDGLLHPHLTHCSSAASVVHQHLMFRHWAFSVAGPATRNYTRLLQDLHVPLTAFT